MYRNFALELLRVTEAAAVSCARLMGRGDMIAADEAAVTAMRAAFDLVPIRGEVVIGEGELDEAPMLYIGEKVGGWGDSDPECAIACDPLEGTKLCAYGRSGALAVVAGTPMGGMLRAPDIYMDKIAVGPVVADVIELSATPTENLHRIAETKRVGLGDLTAAILDRPRNHDLIAEVRRCGARIRLITDGDVSAAVATADPTTGVDVLFGIGGAPEGVLAASALRCQGGNMQARLMFRNSGEEERAKSMGLRDPNAVLKLDDLVGGDVAFSATGVTSGDMLEGVRFTREGATTKSVVMRSKSGTVRYVETQHDFSRKPHYDRDGIMHTNTAIRTR